MNNSEKYEKVFAESLNVEKELVATLAYQSIPSWDSIGHMALMASLEEAFDIMLDADDIIDFSSYEKGKEILAKYGVGI